MWKAIALVMLLAGPAAAQDCVSTEKAITDIRKTAAAAGEGVRAWQMPYSPKVDLLMVWYETEPEFIVVMSFVRGCAVLNRAGTPTSIVPISPEILHDLSEAKLVLKTTEASPVPTF
jgi:hypothetical protein